MSPYTILILCIQALLIQMYAGFLTMFSFTEKLMSVMSGTIKSSSSSSSSSYGGQGTGEVGASGTINACGETCVSGAVPVLGSVSFSGCAPADGSVSICGQCGCGCS